MAAQISLQQRPCRGLLILGVVAMLLSAGGTAGAQQAPSAHEELLHSFYQAPQPERLIGFLAAHGKTYRNWSAYPAVAGFFAVVFRAHPDWIDRLIPAECDSIMAETIAAALRLADQLDKVANAQTCLAAGSDLRLKAEFAGLPSRLEDLRIARPTHLDILWGASFASGDTRYPLMIADYFAQTANRSQPIATDVVMTAIANAGGPKDILGQLKGKYGDAVARDIIFAASALWSLQSNARRHAFVDRALATYIEAHPGSYATKALSAVRPPQRRP